MRLFVAAELPHAIVRDLDAWAVREAGDDPALRVLPAGSLHLTLAFLGERPEGDVPALARAVDEAVGAGPWPGELRIGEVLWLAPRKPHVLTVALVDGSRALTGLQARLLGTLAAAIGFEAEQRAFRPHVTVARVRRGQRPARRGLEPPPRGPGFAPDAVSLMRSHLGAGGARYEALHRATAP